MRLVAAWVFVLLMAAAPALAQQEPPSDEGTSDDAEPSDDGAPPDDAPDDAPPTEAGSPPEGAPDPSSAAATGSTPPGERAVPPPAERAPPPPTPRPASSAGSAGAPRQPAPPPAVIVRHHRDDDDEEEEETPADPGDPYDIVWIELFGGASYVDLRAIEATDYFPEIVRLAGWGPGGGAAIGFRVEFFSLGVRAALARYDVSDAMHPNAVFDVGTVTLEAKLALPIPIVQPFVRVGFGPAWHGDSNVEQTWEMGMAPSNFETTVFGFAFQAAVGLDIYLVHWFAIGAAFCIDLLNMSRQGIEMATDVTLRNSGDAVGLQARGQGAISFHF